MIELQLVGMATGNPENLTLQAIDALKQSDLILLPRKGDDKSDLADARRAICQRFLSNNVPIAEFDLPTRDTANDSYLGGVGDWHEAIAVIWARCIQERGLPAGSRVGVLVWGDPSLYDSTIRIADRLSAHGVEATVSVVPGITSLQLLTAALAIPLNTVGGAVQLTTGRRLRNEGWPKGVDSVAVFLDGGGAFATLPADDLEIFWGAYLGMPQEVCIAGPLSEVASEILKVRAAAREANGWIMDVYLLRRNLPAGAP